MENSILQKDHRNLVARPGILREEIQRRLVWAFRQEVEDLPQRTNLSSLKCKDAVGSRDKRFNLRSCRLADFKVRVNVIPGTRA